MPRSRRIRFDIDLLSYPELGYYLIGPASGLLLVVDRDRRPSELPSGFERMLRIRVAPQDLGDTSAQAREARLRCARFALGFAHRHGSNLERLAICSPDMRVRGPALAAGLLQALDFPAARVHALERRHPDMSISLRRAVLEAAGKVPASTVEKASMSPIAKAAMLLIAKITDSLN